MSDRPNNIMSGLRRMNKKSDEVADLMHDFARRQAEGEMPDPNEFVALLKQRSTVHDVMRAQFKLYEKPMKVAMQEIK